MVNSIENVTRDIKLKLKKAGIEDWGFEGNTLLTHHLNMDKALQVRYKNTIIKNSVLTKIYEDVEKRATHYPLQYILGEWEFMSLPFKVNEDTLIPRADTEILCEEIINRFRYDTVSILDLCSGSGCIGISLAKYIKNSCVTLCDISEGAMEMAKKNAALNNVKATFLQCDLFDGLSVDLTFDIIVSNPPYIRKSDLPFLGRDVAFEPQNALDGGDDGLIFYREIAKNCKKNIKDGGTLAFECGYDQAQDVMKILELEGYKNIEPILDYQNIERVVVAQK